MLVANDIDGRSYQNRYARAKRTAGNVTLTGTSTWSDLTTIGSAMDLTLNASTGDVIEFTASGIVNNINIDIGFDVVTIVSSAAVNSFGLDAAAPANSAAFNGVSAWFCDNNDIRQLSGSIFRTLLAGDISSGTVKMRMRYAMSSATSRTLYADTGHPFEIWARNLGPVTT